VHRTEVSFRRSRGEDNRVQLLSFQSGKIDDGVFDLVIGGQACQDGVKSDTSASECRFSATNLTVPHVLSSWFIGSSVQGNMAVMLKVNSRLKRAFTKKG
jgi:hypothetical protein